MDIIIGLGIAVIALYLLFVIAALPVVAFIFVKVFKKILNRM